MATKQWWKGATIKDKFILGKQLNILKDSVSFDDFRKVMTKPKKTRKRTMFGTTIKSKRRAKVITITSPTAFKRSIRLLRKGRYTLGDQKALQLAKNRATAQLKRKTLSPKERKQMKVISKIIIPKYR